MTRSDNARVRDANKTAPPAPARAKVIPFPQPEPEPSPPILEGLPVILFEEGWEVVKLFPPDTYQEYLIAGMLDVTLFG